MAAKRKPKPGRTLLVDADILAYRHAAGGQRVYKFGDNEDEWCVQVDPLDHVVDEMVAEVEELEDELHATNVVMVLSDTANFRKIVLPTYKANRANVAKPVLLKECRAFIAKRWQCFVKPMLEGDDVLGILATHPTLIKGEKIIVSLDKDLKTIPGTLYNDGRRELRVVTEVEADWWHMMQTLTGDTTDFYKGCPGIGPKKALAALGEPGDATVAEMWPAVVDLFLAHLDKEAGFPVPRARGEIAALVQARVARILRHTDYNFHAKEPILWQPPR